MVLLAYQNIAGSPENTHGSLEWCREKEIRIVFVGEGWIEKNGRGTQTHPSFMLITIAKQRSRVMAYMRKEIEEEMKVVEEEDNLIILEEKIKKSRGGVYANGRWHVVRWKEWLGKLEEAIGGEASLLEDWNAHSYAWDETREEDARGKTMEEWVVAIGWTLVEGDSSPTWERTREGRRESSRINFVISKDRSDWSPIKSTKLLSDH